MHAVPFMSNCLTRIYAAGESTSVMAIKRSLEQLNSATSSHCIQLVDSPDDFLEASARVEQHHRIFFPGGVCSQWDRVISKFALSSIQSSVRAGDDFVGICAGAYYACRHTCFNYAPGEYIQKERPDLSFFKGTAYGPLYPGNIPGEPGKSLALTTIRWRDGSESQALMSGGGYFVPSDEDIEGQTYEVLATYVDQPPERSLAVIRCVVDKGRATLCFPHLEWNAVDLKQTVDFLEQRVDQEAQIALCQLSKSYIKDIPQALWDFKKLLV